MATAQKKIKQNTPEEIKILQEFNEKNASKNTRVEKMENLVHDFDVQGMIDLNERLRAFYKKIGDAKILDLLDRMTIVMQELTEIINQVKSKRLSLEQGQREIQEKIEEINEVLRTMKDWESTGI